MGLLELADLRHTLVDIGTTLLCISGYNGLPGRTLPLNLIHETVWILFKVRSLYYS